MNRLLVNATRRSFTSSRTIARQSLRGERVVSSRYVGRGAFTGGSKLSLMWTGVSTRMLSTESELRKGFLDGARGIGNADQFLRRLDERKKTQDMLSEAEFDEICLESNVTSSEGKAEYVRLMEANGLGLQVSSVRREDRIIYLNPLTLVDQVNIFIDPDAANAEYRAACIASAQLELDLLEQERAAIDTRALRSTKVKMATSAAIITGYVGLTGYLTFYTFSWDTMEPLTYFFGCTVNVIAVLYSGLRREEFDFANQYKKWKENGYKRNCDRENFDFRRYTSLKEYISRLE